MSFLPEQSVRNSDFESIVFGGFFFKKKKNVLAASKFSTDEAKEVGSKKVVCRRCQLPFSLFRSPDKCGECGYAVCSKCS